MRLARFDAGGIGDFNISVRGFWRSFFAAVLVAPGYAVIAGHTAASGHVETTPDNAFAVELLVYAAIWLAYPLVMVPLAMALGLGRRYVAFIVALNWSKVVQVGAFLTALLIGTILSDGPRLGFVAAANIAILVYQWFVTRTALGTTSVVAFGLVVVEFLLSLLIAGVAGRLT